MSWAIALPTRFRSNELLFLRKLVRYADALKRNLKNLSLKEFRNSAAVIPFWSGRADCL
jgi:hypothetical protein